MRRRFLVLWSFMALTSVGSVLAGLGDSDDRIEESYGKLVSRHLLDDGTVTMRYHNDQYLYLVTFDHRQSVLERYSRVDGGELSPREISKFLKSNAGRKVAWTPSGKGNQQRFERSDHLAEANYAKIDG